MKRITLILLLFPIYLLAQDDHDHSHGGHDHGHGAQESDVPITTRRISESSSSKYEAVIAYTDIHSNETTELQLYIQENSHRLPSVTVTSGVSQSTNSNTLSTWLTAPQINRFASGSKNLQDVLRMMPEAQIDIGGTGSVSVAGENYRYNALYTDGVVSHDLFGISASGTFGGITGSSPISLEAMEACKVVFNATDAMQGNFTGAAIQTITKKGSNQSETNAYHYWQNAALAGRTLHEIDNGRHPSKFQASTRGVSARGAFEKNRKC